MTYARASGRGRLIFHGAPLATGIQSEVIMVARYVVAPLITHRRRMVFFAWPASFQGLTRAEMSALLIT